MDLSHKGKYAAPIEEITEKIQKSFSIDEEDMETYHMYIKDGKDAARQGNLSEALELFKSAYKMHSSEKLKSRIMKIEEALTEMANEESDTEEDFVNVNNCGLILFKELHDKLYDHQKEGVAFLYGLHRDGKKGCILADDMGLGKTIQIIAFLSGMYDSELVKHTLLIMPTTLLSNWTKEFAKWTPGMRVKEFHGSKAERDRNLQRVQRKGGVIITTYHMLLSNWELLSSYNGREFRWDYVILDEAHKIKTSSTKTAKSAHAIPAKHRILLTGTPVQNNLSELWALFNFAFQGALLGTAKTFKSEYENPITRARERDATPGEKALGLKISENLMAIINPYFLRRTKQEVQKKKKNDTDGQKSAMNIENENKNPSAAGSAMPTLTRKNDLIVWTYLSQVQEDIYRQFISLEHIKELLMTTRSPLAELTILKKLCDHPRLLSARAVAQLGLEEGINPSDHHDENESAACQIDHIPDETLVSESGKLTFLVALLGRLREEGHRTLVFSQSRKMLDIIDRVLTNKGFKLMRIDGTVIHLPERERRIELFQTNKQYTVFLLTTQVGGVGITLTAANRVVIFDPSWNPATDAQAVDRAYRIGQTENVVIYRLITCGTVEEKIYRRQVFKDSLIRQTTGDKKNPFRYFSQQQLKELFKLEDTRSSSTQLQLQSLHSRQRRTDSELDEHIAYLHSMEMFGISDHDLMFSHDAAVHEDHPEDQESQCYIENRVLKAQELMKAESELQRQFMENIASSTEPAYLRNPGLGKRSTESKPVKVQPDNSPVSVSDYNDVSPAVVDLTQSSPDSDEHVHNLSNKLSEFVLDCSTENKKSPEKDKMKDEMYSRKSPSVVKSFTEVHTEFEVADSSDQEDDERMTSALGDNDSVLSVHDSVDVEELAISDNGEQSCISVDLQNAEVLPTIQNLSVDLDSKVDECDPAVRCQTNSKWSVLQESDIDNEGYIEESWKANSELESFQGNFNLQLEDSAEETFPEKVNGSLVEENPGLKLQMEASLCTEREQSSTENESADCISEDPTDEPSFMYSMKKKKTMRVIYDSEDEEENYNDGHGNLHVKSSFNEPLKGVECSTPKPVKTASFLLSSTPHRKSIGLNASVASRRSLVESMLDDVEDLLEDMDTEEAEQSGDAPQSTGSVSESVMEEEEPSGETLNTESEEKESQSSFVHTGEPEMTDGDSPLEESTGDYELASGESMEQCTQGQKQGNSVATIISKSAHVPDDEYEHLLRTGKECYSAGKLKEALDLFLKAIDIRSGDPEIQLLTIQLYRQLSQL
ncbi:DNA excision repair protein ERCC-6-like [Anguilla anguilla]|uniref:DNA excision repair protein ERCC-6-like n=1 Tax=Anguilla anguilla TaxID=7936 RepID=UPI0015A90439|nr:DNA excision repair protein ERCC-6-like [Anguilla anguilla]